MRTAYEQQNNRIVGSACEGDVGFGRAARAYGVADRVGSRSHVTVRGTGDQPGSECARCNPGGFCLWRMVSGCITPRETREHTCSRGGLARDNRKAASGSHGMDEATAASHATST